MTSLSVPVNSARAIPQEVYRCGDDGQRQLVFLVALPAPPSSCVAERTTTTHGARVEISSTQVAEDLTTRPSRCSNFELQTNEGLPRDRAYTDDDDKLAVPTTRNPEFGTSKSPKSYWLRRHSDSVFAGVDRVHRDDEPTSSVEHASRHAKERTVSDSHSTVNEFDVSRSALADSCKPLTQRFQSIVVGMRQSGESDDVFVEAPAVPPTYSHKDVDLPHSEELNNAQLEHPSRLSHRARLAVVSTGDLEDIYEESQSSCLSEHSADDVVDDVMADSSAFAKLEVNEVGEEQQPQSDSVRSLDNSSWRFSDEVTRYEDDKRKLMNGEAELARPTTVGTRTTIRRRTSRVERPPGTSESTDATSGSGKVHRCTVCRRTFSRSDMLERHARLHTGVRPYACRLCTQVFSRSDHLTTHLRTHTGEKPYACPRCAYTASRRDMVTRHLRVHQSTPAADVALSVSGVVGPPRRRIYRSRYRERTTRRPGVDDSVTAASRTSPPVRQTAPLDARSRVDVRRLNDGGAGLCWPREPSTPPASRRRLEHLQALHALSRSVVARGSTGSTDSYSSPGCLSATDVFEFAVGGSGGIEGSPDVFRSPSSARQSTIFLFPYAAASAALSVCDPADSF